MEPAVEQREDAGGLALINVIDRASIEPTVERREYHATAELGTPGSPAAIEPAIQRRDHNSYTPGRSSITYQLQWIRLSTGGSAAHLNLELYWLGLPQWSPSSGGRSTAPVRRDDHVHLLTVMEPAAERQEKRAVRP